MASLDSEELARIVTVALEEDLAERGDVTTDSVVPEQLQGRGQIVARSSLVLAGGAVAQAVFAKLDPGLVYDVTHEDGSELSAGEIAATVHGSARAILRGERTALNFLMRMSGIASVTRRAVREIAGSGARILDTRKTAPGLRRLDKYAVVVGGGTNHRMGLYDHVMIKDTHLDVIGGSISAAVSKAMQQGHGAAQITVEVRTLPDLEQAIAAGAGRALLDNMSLDQIRSAVTLADGRIELEVSGGLRPGGLRAIAQTGVDCLSLGWLTHSAPAADLALELWTDR